MASNLPKQISVHVISTANGCQTNLLDNALIRRRLERSGYHTVSRPEDADVLIVNSCGFTTDWEQQSLSTVEELTRRFPDKEVMVGGCLPGINGPKLAESFDGFTFGPGQVTRLLDHLERDRKPVKFDGSDESPLAVNFADQQDLASSRTENRILLRLAPLLFKVQRATGRTLQPLDNIARSAAFSHRHFTIQVSTGCRGSCTYCAIKKAKGQVQSRDLEQIMDQLRAGLDAGHQDVWLAADDVGCWGHDRGLDAADLLGRVLQETRDFRLVIGSFHPAWLLELAEKMTPVLMDPRVINLNLPLQSGSPEVLRRMGRAHAPGPVVQLLRQVKARRPDLVLKTHLMVGFPGETEEDFRRTVALVDVFDLVIPFCFTPRPGTPAADLRPPVPPRVRAARLRRLKLAIARRYAAVVLGSTSRRGAGR